eukprot:gene21084-biopygen2632
MGAGFYSLGDPHPVLARTLTRKQLCIHELPLPLTRSLFSYPLWAWYLDPWRSEPRGHPCPKSPSFWAGPKKEKRRSTKSVFAQATMGRHNSHLTQPERGTNLWPDIDRFCTTSSILSPWPMLSLPSWAMARRASRNRHGGLEQGGIAPCPKEWNFVAAPGNVGSHKVESK